MICQKCKRHGKFCWCPTLAEMVAARREGVRDLAALEAALRTIGAPQPRRTT